VKHRDDPPTYFRTNKFTESFKAIVDAYGMASYREVNPGVFTIITFPFMFGIMFGDVGHGTLLFLVALYMCLKEKSIMKMKLDEMVEMCFQGRYLLLLMGVFAIYCGFIYNELFSIPMNIFGSRWQFNPNSNDPLDGQWTNPATAYPFGVDPAWKGSANELIYYNSLKMKLSIIFGVTQMLFGIVLSLFNGLYFRKPYNIWFEFLPQICFMLSIFGYMCFLVFVKWSTNFVAQGKEAPYLLNVMINMFLTPFSIEEGHALVPGQLYLQWLFLIVAGVSVPIMLFPKPFLLRRDHKMGYRRLPDPIPDGEGLTFEDDGHEEDEEEFDFSEVMVHQIIHTIEFVLGSISNTASYLRLWALSLAHSELATVFWDMMFVERGLVSGNFILIFGTCAIWVAMTLGVIMVMESLSAFLHALRLHWVEFQNKFYAGEGYAFAPFSYQRLLHGQD